MDSKEYLKRKTKKTVEVKKIGNAFAAALKNYDQATGEELAPTVVAISLGDLMKQRAEKQAELAELDELIADLKQIDRGGLAPKEG